MVVEARFNLVMPVATVAPWPAPALNGKNWIAVVCGVAGKVADVVLIHAPAFAVVVDPAGRNETCPHTSQSPAVKLMLVTLAAAPLVREMADPLATDDVTNSPTLPAFALLFVVVPTIPAVCDGVIAPVAVSAAVVTVPVNVGDARGAYGDSSVVKPAPLTVLLADSVVNAPVDAVVEPIGPGAANVAAPRVAALMLALQVKPVPLVHVRALADVLQLGIANAVGLADDPVTFATTVFAACAASEVALTFAQPGAVLAPVETIACPLVEPAGLRS